MKNSFKNIITREIGKSLKKYLNTNKTKKVQNEMKQLQINVARQEAKKREYLATYGELNSDVNRRLKSVKIRCGRSKYCDSISCKFDICHCDEHHCVDHICPGTFHSIDCVQYRTYDECPRVRCHRCGSYHY